MHTVTCRNVRFHYNSDLSGDVTMIVRNQRIEKIEQMDTNELLGLEE